MKQVLLDKIGPPEVLKLVESKDIEVQSLKAFEVLIDVHYSGINFADIIMRQGLYPDAPARPFVPGYELSGIIIGLGPKVTGLKLGDEVYAGSFFNGQSEQVRLPSWQVIKKPTHLTLEEACAIPVTFITAHTALIKMGRIQKGDKVFIDCATGGVGTMALTLLKDLGVDVVGATSSPHKKEFIQKLGARAVTHEEFWASEERDFDFILNSQGGSTIKKHLKHLAPTGRVVCLGFSQAISKGRRRPLAFITTILSMLGLNVVSLFDQNKGIFGVNALRLMENTEWIKNYMKEFEWVEKNQLRPVIGKVFKAQDVALAHAAIENRQTQGKVLLKWK